MASKEVYRHLDSSGRITVAAWVEDDEKEKKKISEIKLLKLFKEQKLREENFISNEIEKLSNFEISVYYLKLFFFQKLIRKIPFFEIEYSLPLSCKLVFSLKRGNTKENTTNTLLGAKKNTKEETTALMRTAKELKNSSSSEIQKIKNYLFSHLQASFAVFEKKIEFQGQIINLIQFPDNKSFPLNTSKELNIELNKNKSRTFYTKILRDIQRLIEIDGTKFFNQNENI